MRRATNWGRSSRRASLPANWRQLRRLVLERAGYRCEHVRVDTGRRCEGVANQCDHVGDRLDNSFANLRALCEYHHRVRSSSQGGYAKNKPREVGLPHPGLIED